MEEVENLFTDVLFIRRGRIVLDAEVESLAARFAQVMVTPDRADAARALDPFHEREVFGRRVMTFEGRSHDELAALGEVRTGVLGTPRPRLGAGDHCRGAGGAHFRR